MLLVLSQMCRFLQSNFYTAFFKRGLFYYYYYLVQIGFIKLVNILPNMLRLVAIFYGEGKVSEYLKSNANTPVMVLIGCCVGSIAEPSQKMQRCSFKLETQKMGKRSRNHNHYQFLICKDSKKA